MKERGSKSSNILRHLGVVIGGFLALTILSVLNSAYSYLLDSIKGELSLSYTEIGGLMSAFFVGYTLGQIPWGLLTDKVGSRKVIALSILGVSSATIFFGLSNNFTTAAVARFVQGLLGTGVFVPSIRMIADWFETKERGTVLGVLNIGGSIGLLAVTWTSPMLAIVFGWRLSIEIQGIIGVTSAALIWLSLKDGKKIKNGSRRNLTSALKQRSFWVLAFVQFIHARELLHLPCLAPSNVEGGLWT